jgi:3-phenylpropionate/trans-cinnamate dioxygenase ferredoxin reductase subunit
MSDRRLFVIVGASLAGAKAAETLRQEGFDGRIVLVGQEPARPYERPPLSKELLRGETDPEKAFVHPEAFYADNDIELRRSTRAESIDSAGRRVGLPGGEHLPYDMLLLATGAEPRRLALPGATLDGVFSLRTMEDCRRLGDAIRSASRVAVVGAGGIGCEVAASGALSGWSIGPRP